MTMIKTLGAAMFVLLLFGVVLMGLAGGEVSTHADVKHPEAVFIRTRHRAGMCEGLELWFAPPRGTILVLCGLEGTTEWGGLIYRVTEGNGTILLGEEAYECTVFSASKRYWQAVIARDGYLPLGGFPDVERSFRDLIR